MTARATIRRAWRSTILGGVLAALAIAMPTTASADYVGAPCNSPANPTFACGSPSAMVHPWAGFQGWGMVTTFYCAPATPCPAVGALSPVSGWRWNGAWSSVSLRNGEQVYVYPYAVGWSWVWTARTGWLAVADRYVYVPQRTYGYL